MSRRLGNTNLDFDGILNELANRRMTIADLGTIPEKKEWRYGPDNGPRFVCSVFAVMLLIDGGVLPNTIYPHEFTPNDVSNLKIFKQGSEIPIECRQNDPLLPYCQITGHRSLLPFKYYNSIVPYAHMNENCPSLAPLYNRPDGC